MNESELLKAAVRTNTGAWAETSGKIWGKDRTIGLITPRLNYLQKKIQATVNQFVRLKLPIRILGLKPRQRGSTTYFTALGYTAMRRTSTSAIFIGGQQDQTVGLWTMLKTYNDNDTFNWGNTGTVNEKGATFSNGSRAKKETARDVQAGIGDTYTLLHATEVARWSRYGVNNAADVLTNVLKAVPLNPGTAIFLESTAEGSGNDFHKRWMDAVDAEDFIAGRVTIQPGQYVRVFAPFFEFEDSALRLDTDQKKEIQRTLDSEEEFKGEQQLIDRYGRDDNGTIRLGTAVKDFDVYEQLAWRRYAIHEECKRDKIVFDRDYPHSWQDAFVKSGNLRFNQTGLSVLRKRLKLASVQTGIIEETKGRIVLRPTELGEAKFKIFERPTVGRRYFLSVDPMTGITQVGGQDPDYHAAWVLRQGFWGNNGQWTRPCTAARIIRSRWDIDVLEEAIWKLARYYGPSFGCCIGIEMNQDRGLTELLKTRSANLYMREIFNQREQKTSKAYGYQTNVKTREILVECLAKAIREWDSPGEGIDIWDEDALEQCEQFITRPDGTSGASEGYHDDDPIGIGLGLLLLEHGTVMPPRDTGFLLPPDLREDTVVRANPYS
jgi:hypothetical protein